jgi:hypothetical protein
MKGKRGVAFIMAIILLAALVSGCSSGKKSGEEKADKDSKAVSEVSTGKSEETSDKTETSPAVAMGRYVEEDIAIPNSIDGKNEKIYQMIKNPEGKVELSCRDLNKKPGKDGLIYTMNEDFTWTRNTPGWLNQTGRSAWMAAFFTYSPEGTRYAFCLNFIIKENKREEYILKSSDGNTAEAVSLDKMYTADAYRLKVASGDKLLLNGMTSLSVIQNGKELTRFSHTSAIGYALYQNSLMLPNASGDAVCIYDLNTYKAISEIKLPNEPTNMEITTDVDGNWYMVTDTGIYRLTKNGNTWEQLMDGYMGFMSNPTSQIWDIIVGDNKDIFVLYESDVSIKLKHYVYHSDIPTVPSKKLRITSLKENSTVKKAATEFMNENPDVWIDYTVRMKPDDTKLTADYVKDINTEILNGTGSDIYMLDQMPVDSFIEKGVLADMSDILKPMIEDGTLVANKLNCYERDGKLYCAPLRFGLEFVYGNKEAVAAAKDSLAALANYASNKAKIELLGSKYQTYNDLIRLFFENYSSGLMGEGYTFKKEELKNFLKQIKIITDQTKTVETSDIPRIDLHTWNDSSCFVYSKNWIEMSFLELNNIRDIYAPVEVCNNITKGDWTRINDEKFIPYGIIGINSTSKNKDIASKFIQKCYSSSIQEVNLYDGFPVNNKALNKIVTEKDDYTTGKDNYTAGQPAQEVLQKVVDYANTADQPVDTNRVFLDILVAEITPYLEGKADLESTVDSVIEKTSIFMAE